MLRSLALETDQQLSVPAEGERVSRIKNHDNTRVVSGCLDPHDL